MLLLRSSFEGDPLIQRRHGREAWIECFIFVEGFHKLILPFITVNMLTVKTVCVISSPVQQVIVFKIVLLKFFLLLLEQSFLNFVEVRTFSVVAEWR